MLHSITQLKGTINTCLVNCSKWRVLYARITSPCIQQTFFSIEKCTIVSPSFLPPIVSFRFQMILSLILSVYLQYLLFYFILFLRIHGFKLERCHIARETTNFYGMNVFLSIEIIITKNYYCKRRKEELSRNKGFKRDKFNKNCISASFTF